jgi:hypothetical protein
MGLAVLVEAAESDGLSISSKLSANLVTSVGLAMPVGPINCPYELAAAILGWRTPGTSNRNTSVCSRRNTVEPRRPGPSGGGVFVPDQQPFASTSFGEICGNAVACYVEAHARQGARVLVIRRAPRSWGSERCPRPIR